MKNIVSDCILFIHMFIISFILIVPFTNSNYFLMLHSIFVPFLILHWFTNNNTCVLTTLEKYFRKDNKDDCITCKLINPIFEFTKNHKNMSILTYCVTISVWLISTIKLLLKYKSGKITNITDLFLF